MSAVALIGPDGAGKTTICRMLEESGEIPVRYLYMGVSHASSNASLPTTRLVHSVKRKKGTLKGFPRLRAGARLLNRLAEEWYRQLLSWRYQLQGRVVLYDRHFLFDFTGSDVRKRNRTPTKRLHVWLLTHVYPRPDLTIFLDAPGEVLYRRKGELTPEALERRRQAHLQQVQRLPSVVRVDATRSVDEVQRRVTGIIQAFLAGEPVADGEGREVACSGS